MHDALVQGQGSERIENLYLSNLLLPIVEDKQNYYYYSLYYYLVYEQKAQNI